jgi:cytochrome bd-type quinol oxidase subunit 2
MDLKPSRLRRGEIIAGLSAIVLLVALFGISWFRFGPAGGAHTDASGWNSLPTLRWLIAVTGVCGLLLAFFQASRAAPALPVVWSVIATTLSGLTTLLLIIRIPTDGGSPLIGAFLGLVAVAVLTIGALMSLRQEGGWVPDRDHPIETIGLSPPTRATDS